MYRPGHYGVALLVYAPVGGVLVALGFAALAVVGGAVVLALTPVPDWDQRIPFVSHRGVTHTVLFALVVGAVIGGVGSAVGTSLSLGSNALLAGVGFLVGGTAILAHLLADVITPAGIAPFWPFSGRNYSFGLARADNMVANYALLAAGVLVTVAIIASANAAVLSAVR